MVRGSWVVGRGCGRWAGRGRPSHRVNPARARKLMVVLLYCIARTDLARSLSIDGVVDGTITVDGTVDKCVD